ncbi:MAG: hypothetical protein KKE98_00080 [Nanoarchaeota archaeon]|nr:hypothetical protein [Nanoarchaeota archaeon]MBU2440889.1 hypothetical protein [Nanoarchaeota archaeon]
MGEKPPALYNSLRTLCFDIHLFKMESLSFDMRVCRKALFIVAESAFNNVIININESVVATAYA